MTAKSAPYPPCTVTAFWLKYQDPARMRASGNTTSPYCRAVSNNNALTEKTLGFPQVHENKINSGENTYKSNSSLLSTRQITFEKFFF